MSTGSSGGALGVLLDLVLLQDGAVVFVAAVWKSS